MKPIPDLDPPLEDGVIQLRWLRAEDAEAVTAACRDPQIPRWTFMAEGLTLEQAAEWIEQSLEKRAAGTGARFAIVDVDNDSLLGQVGVAIDWERQSGETFYWSQPTRVGVASRPPHCASSLVGRSTSSHWSASNCLSILTTRRHSESPSGPATCAKGSCDLISRSRTIGWTRWCSRCCRPT